MSDQLPMPTRGPAHALWIPSDDTYEVHAADTGPHSNDGDITIVADCLTDGNAALFAAAIDAATAAADMGFDPIGAVEALPGLIQVLGVLQAGVSASLAADENEGDFGERIEWFGKTIDDALSAARTRGTTP